MTDYLKIAEECGGSRRNRLQTAEMAGDDLARFAERVAKHGGVPEGWKLVPIDATPEMLKQIDQHGELVGDGDLLDSYRAMLAAAPCPPAVSDQSAEIERLKAELAKLKHADWRYEKDFRTAVQGYEEASREVEALTKERDEIAHARDVWAASYAKLEQERGCDAATRTCVCASSASIFGAMKTVATSPESSRTATALKCSATGTNKGVSGLRVAITSTT